MHGFGLVLLGTVFKKEIVLFMGREGEFSGLERGFSSHWLRVLDELPLDWVLNFRHRMR